MTNFDAKNLIKLSDDELKNEFLSIRGKIHASKRKNHETKELEIYYCYITREMERRNQVSFVQNKQ